MSLTIVKCRSCGADIIWLMTKNAKRMPVNAGPEVVEHESAIPGRNPTPPIFDPKVHKSHFGTCPEAKRWSTKK